jgi:hypothetical protein
MDISDFVVLLEDARPYVKEVHDRAEARHDNYGEYYMDQGLWEIMQESEALSQKIDMLLEEYNK